MSENKPNETPEEEVEDNLIPIETIEASRLDTNAPFMPKALSDDPYAGDGSASREGVKVSPWRLHTLGQDQLVSISEPEGSDRQSRKRRRFRRASQKARTERGRTTRKRVRVAVGTLLVLIVAGIAAVAIAYAYELWGGKKVPEVMGLSQTNATQAVEAKGLVVTTETVPSDTVDGHVVSVEPAQGTRVEEGSKVHLVIGTSRTIPEVVGKTREEARAALEAAGAKNIHFETRTTVDEEDRVLEVKPAAGAVFMSTDEVLVFVSQQPRMIDVVGKSEDDALLSLKKEGIEAATSFEKGTVDQRLKVIHTTPEAGKAIGGEGVTIFVGDPLVEVPRVEDYFDAKASHVRDFLQEAGYTPNVGYKTQDGHLVARFANAEGVAVAFVAQPWLHAIDTDKSGYAEVMDDSAAIEGVRLTIPFEEGKADVLGIKDPTVGESTAQDIMKICGLSNMGESCTQSNITLPAGTKSNSDLFYCCDGESEKHIWTVMIKGVSKKGKLAATQAIVTAAPKTAYRGIDLSQHGDKVCDYVAYQQEYK